jgi:hypothetical protein
MIFVVVCLVQCGCFCWSFSPTWTVIQQDASVQNYAKRLLTSQPYSCQFQEISKMTISCGAMGQFVLSYDVTSKFPFSSSSYSAWFLFFFLWYILRCFPYPDYIASNGKLIAGWWFGKDFEARHRGLISSPSICLAQWYSTIFIRVPPDIISLQLCTPKVFGV